MTGSPSAPYPTTRLSVGPGGGPRIPRWPRARGSCGYIITQGEGYTLLRADDGQEWRIDWDAGDTFLCPAWYYHEHFCTGQEQAIMYGIQDMPLLAELRALVFEEPAGAPVRQVQQGFAPRRDTSH